MCTGTSDVIVHHSVPERINGVDTYYTIKTKKSLLVFITKSWDIGKEGRLQLLESRKI